MLPKTILVPFSGGDKELSALEVAFELTKDFAGCVRCLHLSAKERPHDVHLAHKKFLHQAELANIPVTQAGTAPNEHFPHAGFEVAVGVAEEILGAKGRASDLIILGRTLQQAHQDYADIVFSSLFHTGRPVIFTPPKMTSVIGDNVAIAWNDSIQAARALTAALPLIQQARSVQFFTVGDNPQVDVMCDYLKPHGIKAQKQVLHKTGGSIAKTLMDNAIKQDIDLLIMGAFSHSRLREMLLGGVTDSLLSDTPIPVLMMH